MTEIIKCECGCELEINEWNVTSHIKDKWIPREKGKYNCGWVCIKHGCKYPKQLQEKTP